METLDDYQMPKGYGDTIGKCLTYEEIEALLAAERERCAAVVASFGFKPWWTGGASTYEIAAAIRNLAPEPMGGE